MLRNFVIKFKCLSLLQPTSRRQLAVAAAGLAVATDDGTIGKLRIIVIRLFNIRPGGGGIWIESKSIMKILKSDNTP